MAIAAERVVPGPSQIGFIDTVQALPQVSPENGDSISLVRRPIVNNVIFEREPIDSDPPSFFLTDEEAQQQGIYDLVNPEVDVKPKTINPAVVGFAASIAEEKGGLMYTVAFWHCGADKSLAQDIKQDAMVRILSMKSVPELKNRDAWVATVVQRVALERQRKEVRYTSRRVPLERVNSDDDEPDLRTMPSLPSAEDVFFRERDVDLAVAAVSIPRHDVLARYVRGESVEDLGRELGITEKGIRAKIHRSRKELQVRVRPEITSILPSVSSEDV